jgi:predicted GH43/DUF377 family glycosyl hydrolase
MSTSEPIHPVTWELGPWIKLDAVNPCLTPQPASVFDCPLNGSLHWEAKDVFNPAAVVHDAAVCLLYRAEDTVGRHAGTSRIGLAQSTDGAHFTRADQPVLYPDHDHCIEIEWEGGCEDPRIVATGQGDFVLTYTAYDGQTARLCVATSPDLRHWTKHGPAFPAQQDLWSKSGSIVCRLEGERLVATRIGGRYWMYWGESNLFLASSDDLIHWSLLHDPERTTDLESDGHSRTHPPLRVIMPTRPGQFDSDLVEPGPPAILTSNGILLIYNSKNSAAGDPTLPVGAYTPGQALFALDDPSRLIARSTAPFLRPDRPYELRGQMNSVCFVEGLVFFHGRWLLYYGTADSLIAVASCAAPLP